MEEINDITSRIIGASYTVSNTLGHGFLEKVYENALFYELRKSGIFVEAQKKLLVFYESEIVGEYFADLFVENKIIVELKTAKNIDDSHLAQVMNYLRACNLHYGLVINFGKPHVEIKRVVLD